MKIYISADIEGVCGITDWNEADQAHADYAEFRERMTAEVAAACVAALEAGATEITVKDAHGTGRNLLAERFPREVRLVRGWSGHPFCMVQELDASYQAAMFVGYHSRAGSGGNPLAHTLSDSRVAELFVNGEPYSEYRLHALTAALVGVPVVLVSGDAALAEEVASVSPNTETCVTMRGAGWSTIAQHPAVARDSLQAALRRALAGDPSRCLLALPQRFSVEVRYKDQRQAYRCSFYPGARLEAPCSVAFEADEWLEVMRLLQFIA